jgi:hypothetical protein
MSVDETKASQPEDSRSKTGEVRNRNPLLISHDNKFDGPSTAYQDTDLASNFIRKFTKKAGKFRGNNLLRRDFPSVDMFKSSDLIRL